MEYKEVLADGSHPDFIRLSGVLDDYYYERFGDEALKYRAYNDGVEQAVLLYDGGQAIACGGLRGYSDDTTEIKRVYVRPAYRGKGLAKYIVGRLEQLARDAGYICTLLETGSEMIDAISLYKTLGYEITPNFDQYDGDDLCVCMRKVIRNF